MRSRRRRQGDVRRSEFLTARVSPRTKHFVDVLSRLHDESISAVIERALERLTMEALESGGARITRVVEPGVSPTSKSGDQEVIDIAGETWDSEDWCRRLKSYAVYPDLLSPAERAFWNGLIADGGYFRGIGDVTSQVEEFRYGNRVLALGIPNVHLIRPVWEQFVGRTTSNVEA